MLVGNILAVSWPEVWKTAALYGAIGPVPLRLPPPVPGDLHDPRGARRRRGVGPLWDFLFYASFGFVVTSSVAIAGVLLVFCYLIVPSVAAMLYADAWAAAGHRLDDGHDGLGARRLSVARARPADRRDDRVPIVRHRDRRQGHRVLPMWRSDDRSGAGHASRPASKWAGGAPARRPHWRAYPLAHHPVVVCSWPLLLAFAGVPTLQAP